MNCIIIEDQPPAQRILKKYIEDAGNLELAGIFSNALDGMEFLKSTAVDLIFLDIHLPKISGIDFLRSVPNTPYVILTTAFPDYALESYEFNVVDYLLKPFSFQRFIKAISKVPRERQEQLSGGSPESGRFRRREIFVKSGYEHIKVSIAEIRYIKSDADYTEIHLPGKKLLSSEPLNSWMHILDPEIFVRVHKSYIINSSKIEKITGNQVYLENRNIIPLGRAYKEAFLKRFIK